MKKLPSNFSLQKYGLNVRLVNENDAGFILSLRTDPIRTKYMVTLDYNIKKQIKWMQEYKKREKMGLDYYLIYSNLEDKPIGLNRISHIDFQAKTAKTSSWIVVRGLHYESIKMKIIQNEIGFNLLELDTLWCDVHKVNKRAIRILKLFAYKIIDMGTEYNNIAVEKEAFYKACENKMIDVYKNS